MIASEWPQHEADELEAVRRVLAAGRVNYWNGDEGRTFEREFAAYHAVPHAIAVANGTVALELCLQALGIGAGDEVIVTPRTFLASASSVVVRGARPVFADVDRDSGNITPDSVRAVIGPRTRAILPVHLAGWPCDMAGLRALADEYGLYLIEDCAQAHGASVEGCRVGAFGDAAAFSFCTDKIMSTGGEGGMVLLRNEAAWRRAWSYKDHGKDWDAVYNREHGPGFRWLHESIGTNWRLTEMQSAIGRVQLGKLDDWVALRRRNAGILRECLAGLDGVRVPWPGDGVGPAFYKFYAYVRPEALRPGWDRDRIMTTAQAEGVPCMQGICPEIYREKAFLDTGLAPASRLPVARELGETSLMLPVHPTLEEAEVRWMGEVLARIVGAAC